jgi:hypothetical protein
VENQKKVGILNKTGPCSTESASCRARVEWHSQKSRAVRKPHRRIPRRGNTSRICETHSATYRQDRRSETRAQKRTKARAVQKKNATHDDLLTDENNYGLLPWGGGYIVVRTDGYKREIISQNTAQAMTGCSTEHMVERLQATGFWAEIYKPKPTRKT